MRCGFCGRWFWFAARRARHVEQVHLACIARTVRQADRHGAAWRPAPTDPVAARLAMRRPGDPLPLPPDDGEPLVVTPLAQATDAWGAPTCHLRGRR